MTYQPLSIKGNNPRSNIVSPMAKKGLNLEGLPEMMSLEYAKKIVNYIPYSYGIGVRKGLKKIGEQVGLTEGFSLFKYFTDNKFIVGYGTTIASYDISTDTFAVIKADFSANSGFGGDRYGEYFFVTNGVDRPYRIDNAFTIAEVTNAPICDDMTFIGPRAVAISLSTDETAVQLSEVDDGSNPPFDTWNTGTDATAGAIVNYRNAGKARCCVSLSGLYVVFCDDGYYAFSVSQLDSAGTLKKVENVQDYVTDFGGARGAVTTPKGVFYFNEGGLHQLLQVGQTDAPYSRQQKVVSVLLNDSYFENVDMSKVDIAYDEEQKLVLMTYAQDSGVENRVIAYKTSEEIEAIFEIDGWNISRFSRYDQKIYAASSIDGKLFQCFEGWDDDGLSIGVEYAQELPLKSLASSHSLKRFWEKGFLSEDTEVIINFDIYDKEGAPINEIQKFKWTPQRNDNFSDGWGTARWGESSWGGDYDLSTMVESFNGCNPRIANAQRITVRFTASCLEPHIINWFSAEIEDKSPIRIRHNEKLT